MSHVSTIDKLRLYPAGDDENEKKAYFETNVAESHRDNKPIENGVYSSYSGTTDPSVKCDTCGNNKEYCLGHHGMMKLNYPTISPMFIKEALKWLKFICFKCGKIIYDMKSIKGVDKIKQLILKTRSDKNKEVTCFYCGALHPNVRISSEDYVTFEIFGHEKQDKKTKERSDIETLYPREIKKIFKRVTDETVESVGRNKLAHPKKYILSVINIPPITIRPEIRKLGSLSRPNSNKTTILLQMLIKKNDKIPIEAKTNPDKYKKDIYTLQQIYFNMIKGANTQSKKRQLKGGSGAQIKSIAEQWTRKEGFIRQHILGKRCFSTARSVITGIMSKIDEIYIPVHVARTISIPEVVQPFNIDRLRVYVLNKKNRYPGCDKVRKKNGKEYDMTGNISPNFTLENGDIVYRDLITGDAVNFNRQPTLTASSIATNKIVVSENCSTFQMNVLSCTLYHADFDGDNMNLFVQKDIISRNEALILSSVGRWFISRKNASPLIGHIQDSITGLSKLTKSDTYMTKYIAMSLLSQCTKKVRFSESMDEDLLAYDPKAIIYNGKQKLYSGRAILTKLLPTINLKANAGFYDEQYIPYIDYKKDEIEVVIKNGHVISGIIDSGTIGSGSGSIFHIINNEYGYKEALDCCYNVQQLGIQALFKTGSTIHIGDFLISQKAVDEINAIQARMVAEAKEITNKFIEGRLISPIGVSIIDFYNQAISNVLEKGDEFVAPVLKSINPYLNNLYQMIKSGSKGKIEHLYQTCSSLGYQPIEYIAESFGDQRTMAYFARFDKRPDARGFIKNSYMNGINLPELIFLSEAGRLGFIRQALSTSVTGYQERKSVKNLESLVTNYLRSSVKSSNIVQILYGDDGFDIVATEDNKFPTIEISDEKMETDYHSVLKDFPYLKSKNLKKILDAEFEQLLIDRKTYREAFMKLELQTDKNIVSAKRKMPLNIQRIIDNFKNMEEFKKKLKSNKKDNYELDPFDAIENLNTFCKNLGYIYFNKQTEERQMELPFHIIVATELLNILIRSYLCTKNLIRNKITNKMLKKILFKMKDTLSRSLIEYGMSIGIWAAQHISEPLTQMVLDSKHRAGTAVGTKTSGLERQKDLQSVRKTLKLRNPTMTLMCKKYQHDKTKMQKIANHIELLVFHRFLLRRQIFYEEYGNPIHPRFIHEAKLIASFNKHNPLLPVPDDLSGFVIRYELNRMEMILKNVKLETILFRLRLINALYVVHTDESADPVIIRCYIRASKKMPMFDNILNLANTINGINIRGTPSIRSAGVIGKPQTIIAEDGALIKKEIYVIATSGTNFDKILENPYIDKNTIQSDSIWETYETLGIEACRTKLLYESKENMLSVKGVDYRHHCLFADEMCQLGLPLPIEKFGLTSRESNNVLLQLSNSHPKLIVESAAINTTIDNITGISAKLCIGSAPNVGSTYGTIVVNDMFLKEHQKTKEEVTKMV